MKIAELIEKLREFDPETEVYAFGNGCIDPRTPVFKLTAGGELLIEPCAFEEAAYTWKVEAAFKDLEQ